MNDFDQAARFVAEMDPQGTLDRVLAATRLRLRFRRWFPAHTIPRLKSPEREADSVAECDDIDKAERRWLVVIEWQSHPEKAKLRTLLEEATTFASRAQWEGQEYFVMPAIAHLTGSPEKNAEDMRSPSGHGLYGEPAPWEIANDKAAEQLEAIRAGTCSWSVLCWVPLMAGADDDIIVAAWREVLQAAVADEGRRRQIQATALILAELGRIQPTWDRGLKEESIMGESAIMNAMRKIGADQKELEVKRKWLLDSLDAKFPGQMPADVRQLIGQIESAPTLDRWFQAALRAGAYADFDAAVRQ